MSSDIDSDDPIYEVDRLSADKPQRRTVSASVGPSTKLEPFIPTAQTAKLEPFIPVQTAKLAPFIPTAASSTKLEPFIPMTPETPGAEEPASPALRLAQEIATQYKQPAKSELPRLVAGETARGFQEQETQQPESQKPSGNPVQDFIDNIVNRFQQSTSNIAKGQYEQAVKAPDDVQEHYSDPQWMKDQAVIDNPNSPRELVDDIIAKRNQLRGQTEKIQQGFLTEEQKTQQDLQKKALSPEYQQSLPGKISGAIGGAAPYLISGAVTAGPLGPLAPLVVREQMANDTFATVHDQAKTQAAQAHPDWTPAQVEDAATKSATDASQQVSVGLLGMEATGLIPAVGPIIARIVQRIGAGAAGMELSNIYNQWKTNEAIQRHADPNQDLLQHIRDLDFHIENLVSGGAFSLGGALGEIKEPTAPKPEVLPAVTVEGKTPAEPAPVVPKSVKPTGPETGTLTTPPAEKGLGLGQQPGEPPAVAPPVTTPPVAPEVLPPIRAEGQNVPRGILAPETEAVTTLPKAEPVQPEQQLHQALNGEMVVPGTPPGVASHGESEPYISKIANRFNAERIASGEIGEVTPGPGYSQADLLATGLKMSPQEIDQHVSDLMNRTGGDPKLQASAVRVKEASLSQESNNAARLSAADPTNQAARTAADNAFKTLTDFINGPVAAVKHDWNAIGQSLQGEVQMDLSTYNGLKEAFLRNQGEVPPANMDPVFRKTADLMSKAAEADNNVRQKIGAAIDQETAKIKLFSDEELREKIVATMRDQPCSI